MKCMHLNFEIYFTVLCLLYCTSVGEYTRQQITQIHVRLACLFFLHSYDKQITSWLGRLYDFYYSLAVKDR